MRTSASRPVRTTPLACAFLLAGATSHPAEVARYRFDGSGADSSHNGQTATAVGTVTYLPGVLGEAVSLPGDGSHFEVESGPALDQLTDELSIAAWLKAAGGGLPNSILLTKRMPWDAGSPDPQRLADMSMHFGVVIDGFGFSFQWSEWEGAYPGYNVYAPQQGLSAAMSDGRWHMVAVTYRYSSSEDPTLYFDGEEVPGFYQWYVGNTGAVVRESKLWIGNQPPAPGGYRGFIDDVRIFDDKLTPAEVRRMYLAGKAIPEVRAIDSLAASLAPSAFRNPNMQGALHNKLEAVRADLESERLDGARHKVKNDILQKADGCATAGAADGNDWIIGCDEQGQIHPLIEALALGLESAE
jgi:hypothetical protein